MDVIVLIPMLGRAERIPELIQNIERSQGLLCLDVLFIASPNDGPVLFELANPVDRLPTQEDVLVMPSPPERGDYAQKMNAAIRHTTQPWIFLGASDLDFRQGWADIAVTTALRTGRRVIGTNDLGNHQVVRGKHSTHSIFHRSYADCGTIDDPAVVLNEGYFHNWVDAEFIETAKHRGEFEPELDAIVEHLHPHWGKGKMDETYERGLSEYHEDQALFRRRVKLWNG